MLYNTPPINYFPSNFSKIFNISLIPSSFNISSILSVTFIFRSSVFFHFGHKIKKLLFLNLQSSE